jgi:Flp pilus assembly protein TadG
MILGMLGMVEVGYAFMIKQTITLAAREGARTGSLPGAEMADCQAAVDEAMASANLTGYTVTSNISSLAATDPEVWVDVSIPFSRVGFTGQLLGGGGFNITSRTSMRREGVN